MPSWLKQKVIILMDMGLLGQFYKASLSDCSQSPADRHSQSVLGFPLQAAIFILGHQIA